MARKCGVGNKNTGTTKKWSKGNSGPNFAEVWKTLKSSQTRGTVFAQRFIPRPCLFIHGECVMHESTNIHIWHHSALKATMFWLVLWTSVHKGISRWFSAFWRNRLLAQLESPCSTRTSEFPKGVMCNVWRWLIRTDDTSCQVTVTWHLLLAA
jgi:hypothetical protein